MSTNDLAYVSVIERYSNTLAHKVNIHMGKDGIEFEKLKLGITIILINISKLIAVLMVAILMGVLPESILSIIVYSLLRRYSFGIHAPKDYICTIVTIVIHVGTGMLSSKLILNNFIVLSWFFVLTMLIYKYAPADTKKRPILGKDNRQALRRKSTLTIIAIAIIAIVSSNNLVKNILLLASLLQTITILPITYKLSGEGYKNYEKYEG